MDDRLEALLDKIRSLEFELLQEMMNKQKEFLYDIDKKIVRFQDVAVKRHRKLIKKLRHYLKDAALLNILTAPVIWSCLIPAVILDAVISFYQFVCFPVYGIPKVQRGDYILLDRGFLSYLNIMERLNCFYCAYFNGVIGYAREIAARTEQYWCPIKHARRVRGIHSRYKKFLNYGDGEGYRERIETVRRDFSDIDKD
ncbi:MAG: hypothetical protein G3M70_05765 [Candidatus Nitronauta litoralis]|uniref:Uncharacterized protein n=1 Tax=Candidatus Nitronauta litoralis TaxID=2705533 RepID=A0A7T0G1Q8_9BACT|nr:MAG: hypothetical protein G3M70_05765 [Candidatus Nitronauta litoralis]